MTQHPHDIYWVLCRDSTENVGKVFEAGKTIWSFTEKFWKLPRGLDQSVNKLKRKRDALDSLKKDTESIIREEQHPRKKVKEEVKLWLDNVESVKVDIRILESEVGPSSLYSRGFLVKEILKKTEEVEELIQRGGFSDGLVVDDCSRIGQWLPTPNFVGQTIVAKRNEIVEHVMNDEDRKIGIHGMPGVGKTSVSKLVNNEILFNAANRFNVVVWVTVSRKCGVIELQNKIAKAMNADISDVEDEATRAGILSEILRRKGRYVLILDDVWDHFSLEDVGIPEPTTSNGSKLVITTRSLDVCRRMDCLRETRMDPLPEAEAWTLFLSKVGEDLLSFGESVTVARSVADKCSGLPLALITIASSMKGEYSLPIWKNTFNELNKNIQTVNSVDVKDMIFQNLRFSYDRLNNSEIKNCFRSCTSYHEDLGISKQQLIQDWIKKGLIGDIGNMQAKLDRGEAILRQLVDNCLLEKVETGRLKMHDLVRDMAVHINEEFYSS